MLSKFVANNRNLILKNKDEIQFVSLTSHFTSLLPPLSFNISFPKSILSQPQIPLDRMNHAQWSPGHVAVAVNDQELNVHSCRERGQKQGQ